MGKSYSQFHTSAHEVRALETGMAYPTQRSKDAKKKVEKRR